MHVQLYSLQEAANMKNRKANFSHPVDLQNAKFSPFLTQAVSL